MRRISLCLLIAIASASVGAREVKRCGANGSGGASESVARPAAAAPRKPVPGRDGSTSEQRSRPSIHSDVANPPRSRWHSFVPGMFR